MHRQVASLIAVGLLAAVGCGGGTTRDAMPIEAEATPAAVGTQPVVPVPAGGTWRDPEPPDAQAAAEEVIDAQWNRNKTTRLEMSITTLVDTTTGIEGWASVLAPTEESLDDRLVRLGAKVSDTEVTIRLAGSVLFDFDSAAIRPDAERTLLEVAEVLRGFGDRPARIEGHTDSIASDVYNQQLSEQRAEAVSAWHVERGIDGARLTTVGHGEGQPVADNSTADGRQANRRVEIVIDTRG
jgi:outer membrane protein OmpA-like peptidoglycan-associated protein